MIFQRQKSGHLGGDCHSGGKRSLCTPAAAALQLCSEEKKKEEEEETEQTEYSQPHWAIIGTAVRCIPVSDCTDLFFSSRSTT